MELRELKIIQGTYKEKIFITPTDTSIKDYFTFNLTRSILQNMFLR